MYLVNIPNTELYIVSFGPDTNQFSVGSIINAQQFASYEDANNFIMNEAEFYPPIWLAPCIAISPNSPLINP
jgi:hypothetical protein